MREKERVDWDELKLRGREHEADHVLGVSSYFTL